MKDEPIDLSPVGQRRAAIQIRRSNARDHVRRPGRPLDGDEPKVRVTNRWEPSMIDELQKMTGCSTKELVERFYGLLCLVAEYRRARDAMLREMKALGIEPLDKAS
jgi:hypothetical protein